MATIDIRNADDSHIDKIIVSDGLAIIKPDYSGHFLCIDEYDTGECITVCNIYDARNLVKALEKALKLWEN